MLIILLVAFGAVVAAGLPLVLGATGARNWYLPESLGWLPKFEHEPEVGPAAA